MPFVRISLLDETPPAARVAVGDAVHEALVTVAGVRRGERFQVIETHAATELVFDTSFGAAARQRVVFVEITLVRELSNARKRLLYRDIADRLREAAGVRPDDVFV